MRRQWIALLALGLAAYRSDASFSELVTSETTLEQPRRLNITSPLNLTRPTFSHEKETYSHDKARVFRLFAGFHDLLDQVWEKTNVQVRWENERRYVSHHMIPMRDGTKLSTIVIRPTLDDEDKRSALLSRSPYGPTSDQIASLFMATNGFVAVIQDQRGTFLSEGEFSMWRHDGHDGYDTMEWIAKQPWSDGQVFSAGISADGCGAFTQILDGPKWLKGQFLMLASANAHETVYPGGAFRQGLVEGWMTAMSIFTRGKSLTHTLPEIMEHEALSSWYDTVEADKYYGNVRWPTVHLTGWWDIFSGHQLKAFDELARSSHASVRRQHRLFVGPYGHCELGNLDRPLVSLHEAKAWVNSFGFAMEMFAGKTDGHFHKISKRINIFVQGPYMSDGQREHFGNFWSSLDDWPEVKPVKLFFARRHSLRVENNWFDMNDGSEDPLGAGDDEYVYSPGNPTPTIGGNNLILMDLGYKCGPQDQRKNEERKDVVVFTTSKPLTKPLAITGRVQAVLYVSSNRPDTDFTVSLNDVYPDGLHYRSVQVRYGIKRMRWRDGAEKEAPKIDSEAVYRITVDLWPTSYVFNPGHKIRVTVSSSNAPYYMKNDNLDDALIHGRPDFARERAKNAVHFSEEFPSHLLLPVVELDDLVPNPHF